MAAVIGGNFTQLSECCSRKPAEVCVWNVERKRGRAVDRASLKHRLVFDGLRLLSRDWPVFTKCMNERRSTNFIERHPRRKVTCQDGKVKVTFRLEHQVDFGEHHALLGSIASAGAWQTKVMMGWSNAGWVVDLEMDPGEEFEFKYLTITRNGDIIWENGGNRSVVVPGDYEDGMHYEVVSYWDSTHHETLLKVINRTLTTQDEVRTDEEVNEKLEDILQQKPKENLAEVSEGKLEAEIPEEKSEVISVDVLNSIPEEILSEVPEEKPEAIPEDVSNAMSEGRLPESQDEKPEVMSQQITNAILDGELSEVPGGMLDVIPEEMSNVIPEGKLPEVQDEKPEAMPEETSNKTPEGKLGVSADIENGSASYEKMPDIASSVRVGKWDTCELDKPAKHIVEGDQKSANWWRKLEVVCSLLTRDLVKNDRLKSLIYASIYLKWINTGQIPCHDEGSGHCLPTKHAEISRRIFRELERIVSAKNVSPMEVLVVRRIHPCLPACKAEFTLYEPFPPSQDMHLHNDIPHDVKVEIEHTIKSELHFNPVPEDLVATEAVLAQVSQSPGKYSADFAEEFGVFHRELRKFFNAESLTEQLEGLRDSFDEQKLSVMECFLKSKKNLDEANNMKMLTAEEELELTAGTLRNLSRLKILLKKGLESGIRNDAPDDAIAMRQKWRLSEIGLEDYSFVLLSRYRNSLERAGGASWLIKEANSANVQIWHQPLCVMGLGIQQIGLSGWQPKECLAIESELSAWQSGGIVNGEGLVEDTKLWARRLNATLIRIQRLAETYTDALHQLYPACAQVLGHAFGLPKNQVTKFANTEIQSSLMVQLSKLVSILVKASFDVSGSEGSDTLMPGKAIGILMEVDRIVPGCLPSPLTEPVLLLVKKADGDEEVTTDGLNVTGVILQHELPHFSHLGVRSRQEKKVFVTLNDEEKVAKLRSLLGKMVRLDASAEGAFFSLHDGASNQEGEPAAVASKDRLQEEEEGGGSSRRGAEAMKLSNLGTSKAKNTVTPVTGLDLSIIDVQQAGYKAVGCRELAQLANISKRVISEQGVHVMFEVPKSLVIPFGAMEEALEASGLRQEFQFLLDQSQTTHVGGVLDLTCKKLQELVSSLRPAELLINSIASYFSPTTRLIVRSSANLEDSAGLYDSISNVSLSDVQAFGRAVAKVWASLYTQRAVLSRRVGGIPHEAPGMAILVQELLSPDLSFVLYTMSPLDHDKNIVQAEIAPGLGETLASATRGFPWRLAAHKFSGNVETLAFANFNEELIPCGEGADRALTRQVVDYSTKAMSVDPGFRMKTGRRLATIGCFLEQKFGSPQDIEGCIVGENIYLVQARPQRSQFS